MIAVRAISSPFKTLVNKADGSKGEIKSRINTVYLFDSEVEDIYLSMSVLEAVTNISGSKETLRHEVATYKTDVAGRPVDLTGLDKKFENFVRRIGFAKDSLKIVDGVSLPLWAHSYAAGSAQVASIAASISCEGAANPVVTVSLPVSKTFALQSFGPTGPLGALAGAKTNAVGNSLTAAVPGMAGADIVAAPLIFGLAPGTAAIVAGGATAGVVAAGGGGGGGGGSVSP